MICNISWSFLLIVGHHDEGFSASLAERLYDVFHHTAVYVVESVKGLVEDKQFGVFHEGSRQQHKSLFATRELQKGALCQISDTEDIKPPSTFFIVALIGHSIQADGVHQSAGYYPYCWQIPFV